MKKTLVVENQNEDKIKGLNIPKKVEGDCLKKESKLEIDRILTLSTGHVTESTSELLNNDGIPGLIVYPKDAYGWFILCSEEEKTDEPITIPDDLTEVIKFAIANDCTWLCLDRDGYFTDKLPKYEW